MKTEKQLYLEKVLRLAGPANPFEKQIEQYEGFDELKTAIEQLRLAGYDIQNTVALVKDAIKK